MQIIYIYLHVYIYKHGCVCVHVPTSVCAKIHMAIQHKLLWSRNEKSQ